MPELKFPSSGESWTPPKGREVILWGVHDGTSLTEKRINAPIHAYVDDMRAGRIYRGRVIAAPDEPGLFDPVRHVVVFTYYWIRSLPKYIAFMDAMGMDYVLPAAPTPACAFPPPDPAPNDAIDLVLMQMSLGGAERQMTALGAGLIKAGFPVRLLTLRPHRPECGHYLSEAEAAGLPIVDLSPTAAATAVEDRADACSVHGLPDRFAWDAHILAEQFRAVRPRAVICYLDLPNIIGGWAAASAGIPNILLSGRNRSPDHFPHLFGSQSDELRGLYRRLAARPGTALFGNSGESARSYESWLGLRPNSLAVVHNACAPWAFSAAPRQDRSCPVIAGMFRLSPEKRPLDFIKALAALRCATPHWRAVLYGDGPLDAQCRSLIDALELADHIRLAGSTKKPQDALAQADMLLHTAEAEGLPNVLLEAQAMGLPVAATALPGCLEALSPELHAYSAPVGDIDGLARSLASFLESTKLRRELGERSAVWVRSRFTQDRLTQNTLALIAQPPQDPQHMSP